MPWFSINILASYLRDPRFGSQLKNYDFLGFSFIPSRKCRIIPQDRP
jgi:hypothetical protein